MVAPIGGINPLAGAGALGGALTPSAPAAANPAGGADFGNVLSKGLENLQNLQSKSDDLAVQAATGDLQDVHDYMIAATEASVATDLTVAVRNKAVSAFNEIMRMQM